MRLGLLLTNTDRSAFARRHPNDGQKLVEWFSLVRPQWQCAVIPAMDGVLPKSEREYDAYVITGSPSSVNDNAAWIGALENFLLNAFAAAVPLVGLCFGHQLLAKAFGGRVGRPLASLQSPWGLGVAETLFPVAMPFMTPLQTNVNLLAAHNEQVLHLPSNARVIGSNAFCANASLLIGSTVLTSQYHPEMSREFFLELLVELQGKVPEAALEGARNQVLENPSDDSLVFMHWIANFIEQAYI